MTGDRADARQPPARSAIPDPGRLFADVAGLLGLALLLRLLAYNGIFGSDDTTYFARAVEVASGEWTSADYNGALRYGFNIPAGLFVWLLGPTPWAANVWPLLCSLIEVVAIYVMASSIAGRAGGLFAGVLLACAPIHIAVATRIHADPVVSMFVTLSFVLLWFGWQRRSTRLLFLCGLSLGGIFWAKELVGVVWIAFLPMLWLFRGRWLDALAVIGGVLSMLALHGLLMWLIAGDPLHLVKTVLGQVQTTFIGARQGEDAPLYYLRYLFVDLRHLGLVAVIAVAGVFLVRRSMAGSGVKVDAYVYVWVWVAALIAVLSVFPVSLSPLRFVMKQSNYVTLFLGGIAVLGGVALACMSRGRGLAVGVMASLLGIWLGFLQQADYRAFGAGSKALGDWVAAQPDVVVVGSVNNASLGNFQARLSAPDSYSQRIWSFRNVHEESNDALRAIASASFVYVASDPQTRQWPPGRFNVVAPLSCWGDPVLSLDPVDLGLGNRVAGLSGKVSGFAGRFGVPGMQSLAHKLFAMARPEPVTLYRPDRVSVLCKD